MVSDVDLPVITNDAPIAKKSPSMPQFSSQSRDLKVYCFLPFPEVENNPSMTMVYIAMMIMGATATMTSSHGTGTRSWTAYL